MRALIPPPIRYHESPADAKGSPERLRRVAALAAEAERMDPEMLSRRRGAAKGKPKEPSARYTTPAVWQAIAEAVGEGKSTRQVAALLGLHCSTVARVIRRLGIHPAFGPRGRRLEAERQSVT